MLISHPRSLWLFMPLAGRHELHANLQHEQGDIADVLFRVACKMGLEGIDLKRLDRAYGVGKCNHWIKINNPAHPAYCRGARVTIEK
jgi:ATP-dependent DNA ligase